jgi:glucokinase
MILACDVGGTSTRVALFEPHCDRAVMMGSDTFRSGQYRSLESIVEEFRLQHRDKLTAACFGVAGPVSEGKCITTNLPWHVELKQLQAVLGIEHVMLINDLVANAWGIDWLTPDDFVTLHAGSADETGNRAVISHGTGLGEAGMICVDGRYRPFASEGGHAEFGPRSDTQFDLARYLERRFGRVSYENVLSGPGLVNIYTFLRNSARGDEPEWFADELKRNDPAARISEAALNDELPICVDTMRIFLKIFGAEAGNLALKLMATGGIWLGGGIVPKIMPLIVSTPYFMEGFTAKGKLSHIVEKISIKAIRNQHTALLGAARYAARLGIP